MGYNRILCAVTCSEESQRGAAKAAELAQQSQAELVYFFVSDPVFLNGISFCAQFDMLKDNFDKLAKLALDAACAEAAKHGVTPRTLVLYGAVVPELKKLLTSEHADLLVVGHEERKRFMEFVYKDGVEESAEKLRKELGFNLLVV
ncbi:MAG: universal stress protein UspC [Deltaproteobacteria bacterium ADurb.Bin510]|nr:MAG: universal stress protein UspC [Deltaproteobacteria bacterium ADurb.Bin510]